MKAKNPYGCKRVKHMEPKGELKKCPFCGKVYRTELVRPRFSTRKVQEIFPDEPAWKREQLISGVCSQECWDRNLRGDGIGT